MRCANGSVIVALVVACLAVGLFAWHHSVAPAASTDDAALGRRCRRRGPLCLSRCRRQAGRLRGRSCRRAGAAAGTADRIRAGFLGERCRKTSSAATSTSSSTATSGRRPASSRWPRPSPTTSPPSSSWSPQGTATGRDPIASLGRPAQAATRTAAGSGVGVLRGSLAEVYMRKEFGRDVDVARLQGRHDRSDGPGARKRTARRHGAGRPDRRLLSAEHDFQDLQIVGEAREVSKDTATTSSSLPPGRTRPCTTGSTSALRGMIEDGTLRKIYEKQRHLE